MSSPFAFLVQLCLCLWLCTHLTSSASSAPLPHPDYPLPIPANGRQAVHGWLILPFQVQKNMPYALDAWFVHHVPEFWTDSPHDWQMIVLGTLTIIPVANNESYPLEIPYNTKLIGTEYSFTPPPNFSLNDMLNGELTSLLGSVYNGSFDTSYERIPIALGRLDISQLTTATYVNESKSQHEYPTLQYLIYPRDPYHTESSGIVQVYLSHQIHLQPDFDQIIQVNVNLNTCKQAHLIYSAGSSWSIPNTINTLENRLLSSDKWISMVHMESGSSCDIQVLEEIHCMIGPGFEKHC